MKIKELSLIKLSFLQALWFVVITTFLSAGDARGQTYQFTTLNFPGAYETRIYGINNSGGMVGYYRESSGAGPTHGFIYKDGNFVTIDAPTDPPFNALAGTTKAHAINDSGDVVGSYTMVGAGEVDFLYQSGAFSILDGLPPYGLVNGTGINNTTSLMVGNYGTTNMGNRSFFKEGSSTSTIAFPGAFTDVGYNPPFLRTYAYGINNNGDIVGGYNLDDGSGEHGFLCAKGDSRTYQPMVYYPWPQSGGDWTICHGSSIDVPGGTTTQAYGINDYGDIVGTYGQVIPNGSTNQGFLYSKGVYTLIDYPQFSEDYNREFPRGINNSGTIVGYYSVYESGVLRTHGFIATPLIYYDQFPGSDIDPNKWKNWEFVREIREFNEERKLFIKTAAYGSSITNRLPIKDGQFITHMEADVAVTEMEGRYGLNEDNLIAFPAAGLGGMFYNDGTGSSGSYLGEVGASLLLRPDPTQLQSEWVVVRYTNASGTAWDILGSGTLSTGLMIGQTYRLNLDWNPSTNTFTFGDGMAAPQTFQPQDTPQSAMVGWKALRAYPLIMSNGTQFASAPELWAIVSATFDNVLASGQNGSGNPVIINEDFSSAQIDPTKWTAREFVREIQDGKLVTKIRNQNDVYMGFKNPDLINEIQTKVTINDFQSSDGAWRDSKIGGYFYNDTGDLNNGGLHDVWAQLYIGGSGTSLSARWRVIRYNTSTLLGDDLLSIPISAGTTYTLYLQWDGTQFIFRCADQSGQEASATYTPTTSIYPVYTKWKGLMTTVIPPTPTPPSYEAFISTSFDDVMVGVMGTEGTISGQVSDYLGSGLAGVDVSAQDASGNWVQGTTTGLDGNYSLLVPAGSYMVYFNPWRAEGSFLPEYYNDKSTLEEADTVVVVTGQTTADINAQLQIQPEATPSSLSITSHIDGQQVNTAGITLMGTASDAGRGNNGISQVTVNGIRADNDTASGSGIANWSKTITLIPGSNTITVIAYDDSPNHNSTLQSITINYAALNTGKTDFDGDGKTDIAVWRPGDGNWYIRNSATGNKAAQQWGAGALNDWPVPGDYDGDGKVDYGVWRPGDGRWYILRSSDGGMTATQWGTGTLFPNSDVPVPGNYDGDTKMDIAVWRPGDGNWYILRSSDGGVTATQWGAGSLNDLPVPGDYDGDGKTDLAVWRPGDGNWYILRSSDGGVTATQWGTGTLFAKSDVPVPGDYDGDGKTDIAIWRPGDGNWYILRSSDGGVTATQWGTGTLFAKSDVPVPGDYDGDGKADIAVWRPGDGVWYILRSSDGSITATQWGAGDLNDVPIVDNGLIYRYLEGSLY